jgi:hypothetical protein
LESELPGEVTVRSTVYVIDGIRSVGVRPDPKLLSSKFQL